MCQYETTYETVKVAVVEIRFGWIRLPAGYGKSLIYQLLPFIFKAYLYHENSSSSVIFKLDSQKV
jgi:hypothetical protein